MPLYDESFEELEITTTASIIDKIKLESVDSISQLVEIHILEKQDNLKKFKCCLNLGAQKICVNKTFTTYKAFLHHVLSHAFYDYEIQCKQVMRLGFGCDQTFVEVE